MREFSRQIQAFVLFLGLCMLLAGTAQAQDAVRILFPQDGQEVRGQITVRFAGVPTGGYLMLRLDDELIQATAETTYTLNTFELEDGEHRIHISAISAAGRKVGEASTTFQVSNKTVDVGAEGVRMVHWQPSDRLAGVHRYRIFAESSAIIEEGGAAGGPGGAGMGGGEGAGGGMPGMGGRPGGGGGRGGGGGTDSGPETIPAPLDWQVAALLRRMVRDVAMLDGSANIQTVIQSAVQRQRAEAEAGGTGGGTGRGTAPRRRRASTDAAEAPAGPTKADWGAWEPAAETGQYFVKMIQPSGREINAIRKAPTIVLTDLLPEFPLGEVRPGSQWETTMTFIGELSERTPVNVRAPISFTAFENVQTPNGVNRRAAKLESRFRLPEDIARKIALALAAKVGTTGARGGAGGAGEAGAGAEGAAPGEGAGPGGRPAGAPPGAGGAPGGGAAAEAEEIDPEEITVARSEVARTLWFDIENRRVLRSQDVVTTYFERLPLEGPEGFGGEGMMGGGMGRGAMAPGGMAPGGMAPGGMAGGPRPGAGMGGVGQGGMTGEMGMDAAPAAPPEPTRVNYSLVVTTWYDDAPPSPTSTWTAGAGTAHARDSVEEPPISRVTRPGGQGQ